MLSIEDFQNKNYENNNIKIIKMFSSILLEHLLYIVKLFHTSPCMDRPKMGYRINSIFISVKRFVN